MDMVSVDLFTSASCVGSAFDEEDCIVETLGYRDLATQIADMTVAGIQLDAWRGGYDTYLYGDSVDPEEYEVSPFTRMDFDLGDALEYANLLKEKFNAMRNEALVAEQAKERLESEKRRLAMKAQLDEYMKGAGVTGKDPAGDPSATGS